MNEILNFLKYAILFVLGILLLPFIASIFFCVESIAILVLVVVAIVCAIVYNKDE